MVKALRVSENQAGYQWMVERTRRGWKLDEYAAEARVVNGDVGRRVVCLYKARRRGEETEWLVQTERDYCLGDKGEWCTAEQVWRQ